MKLLRYGPAGYEKPGVLDTAGKIRDLSGAIDQVDSLHLAPRELKKLAQVKTESLPSFPGHPGLACRISASANSSRSASTTPTMPPSRACRCPPSRSCS